jgi:hypothetical protein
MKRERTGLRITAGAVKRAAVAGVTGCCRDGHETRLFVA